MSLGCPAMSFVDPASIDQSEVSETESDSFGSKVSDNRCGVDGKVVIDTAFCVGCGMCCELCVKEAIV